jgi:hypothetical protein
MGWMNLDQPFCSGLHPAPTWNLAASEDERVRLTIINDGKFEIAIERRGRDGLPHSKHSLSNFGYQL